MAVETFMASNQALQREITVYSHDREPPTRLFLFLDAEFYLDRMGIAEKVQSQLHKDTAFAFVAHIDNLHRHRDYICSPSFSAFAGNAVLGEIQHRFPTLHDTGHLVGGLSLSGLAAAHLLEVFPERFDGALCQSGSFWWNDEWLTDNMPRTTGKRLYISVGDKETQKGISHQPSGMRQEVSQFDSCTRFAEQMKIQGNEVRLKTFHAGHEMEPWETEWIEAVDWMLLPKNRHF
ncbi:MAG: hypothetical protein CMO55_19845 [Verrucomicrobiales bacterium]|nr:hypothetical protein [Verrucomicrobiales bacterium]